MDKVSDSRLLKKFVYRTAQVKGIRVFRRFSFTVVIKLRFVGSSAEKNSRVRLGCMILRLGWLFSEALLLRVSQLECNCRR